MFGQGVWLDSGTAKTKIICCSTAPRMNSLTSTVVRVGEDHVPPSATVRDLGFFSDNDIAMRPCVTYLSVCFAIHYDSSAASDIRSLTLCSRRRWCRCYWKHQPNLPMKKWLDLLRRDSGCPPVDQWWKAISYGHGVEATLRLHL